MQSAATTRRKVWANMGRRDYAGFNRSVVQAADEDWAKVRRYNSLLRSLAKRRVGKVERVGHLAQSKIAWKVAVLQQALLYRIVELANGCAKMWNEGNVLCSALAGRALLETVAVMLDFEAKLEKHFKANDFGAMDELVNFHTFATRNEEWLKEDQAYEAKNVLTYIDRLEKQKGLIGARMHYEHLSEFCHPNCNGLYIAFGKLDTSTGTVAFSKLKRHDKGMLNSILAVYLTLGFVEATMDNLDELVPKISEAHSAAHPVPH